LEGKKFQIPKQFPARVSTSRISDNSNDIFFLKPKNVDTGGRIAPENYTISHNRMNMRNKSFLMFAETYKV
jgi:hypothetical protein